MRSFDVGRGAALQRHGGVDRDLHGLEARVRRRRDEIELRGRGGVGRLERDVIGAHRHVQTVLRPQREWFLAASNARAVAGPDVDDAELAAREERHAGLRARFARAGATAVAHGRGAADHEALVVRVVERDALGREQARHEIAVAQLLVARRPSIMSGCVA